MKEENLQRITAIVERLNEIEPKIEALMEENILISLVANTSHLIIGTSNRSKADPFFNANQTYINSVIEVLKTEKTALLKEFESL